MFPVNPMILRDFTSIKSLHDCDSIVSTLLLDHLRTKYFISIMFDLDVPQPDQCPFDPMLGSFCLSCDALEAGLYLSLHPIIVFCLKWWGISYSQMMPNS
ncbi:unnamed protein product [Musa acuminata subsp. burmannicoides]